MFNLLVTNYVPLFNGAAGLSLVPVAAPGRRSIRSRPATSGATAPSRVLLAFVDLPVRAPASRSPRTAARCVRCATTTWSPTRSARTCARCGPPRWSSAARSPACPAAILVGFINLWDPQAWGYAETVVLFAAVIIGGLGNHRGAMLGAILVPLAFEEATRYIPPVPSNPDLVPALQWVVIGLLIVVFLWFRPQGILPERRRVIARRARGAPLPPRRRGATPPGGPRSTAGATAARPLARAASPATDPRVPGLDPQLRRRPRGRRRVDGIRARPADRDHRAQRRRQVDAAGDARRHAAPERGPDRLPRARTSRAARLPPGAARPRADVPARERVQAPDGDREPADGDSWPARRDLSGALLGRRYWGAQERDAIDRAKAMLERFGLVALADRYAGDLSGGQRRLVEIMRALMAEPEVLLLDEPMAGVILDWRTRSACGSFP